MASKDQVKKCWRLAEAVCFDVDSTVCIDEGLDDLAAFCGVGAEVEKITLKAMGGSMTFREALTQRLNIVQPTQEKLNAFIKDHPPKLSPGVKDLVRLLMRMNKKVFLVSGGFRRIIEPVAVALSLPADHIFANTLLFNNDGSYAGFDLKEPTSESGGKPRAIQQIKEKHGISHLVMVGDGATDMEACPPASAFIGYGGNVVRDKVKNGAAWFVTDFKELIDELETMGTDS
ncbi:phosphoserine phosphatase [Plakobranchus ocellatus]|uniref:Phosphoserine phosphatase n=1 Tax=Plakobranchus ocellatus TaxID=259542 RepID=A0AAV3Y354_9GAST|nr:phosphoserine phosphatase [Plakobranchus ocellatus]